jgi:hypothetical protein
MIFSATIFRYFPLLSASSDRRNSEKWRDRSQISVIFARSDHDRAIFDEIRDFQPVAAWFSATFR